MEGDAQAGVALPGVVLPPVVAVVDRATAVAEEARPVRIGRPAAVAGSRCASGRCATPLVLDRLAEEQRRAVRLVEECGGAGA
ncbi:MAG TPA: hypothetical protein VII50_02270, partial [Acidothermaceae bacterium]